MSQTSVQLFAFTLILIVCLLTQQVAEVASEFEQVSSAEVAQIDPMLNFRQTSDGWQDSANWRLTREESRVRAIDSFHPLLWTVLVLIAVLIAMVLSTGEEELALMLGDSGSGQPKNQLSSEVTDIVRSATQPREL